MAILDFDALIRHLGLAAVEMSLGESKKESAAIAIVLDQSLNGRAPAVRRWLEYYKVFQGFTSNQRDAVSEAVLNWSDSQPSDSTLVTLESLLSAHASLANACAIAYGKQRDFASLASKALWLRYPNEVPIYDSFAQRALWMAAKIEPGLPTILTGETSYASFALIWRAFYERYSSAFAAIPNRGYPYQVRIFDRILWILGAPTYTAGEAPAIDEPND